MDQNTHQQFSILPKLKPAGATYVLLIIIYRCMWIENISKFIFYFSSKTSIRYSVLLLLPGRSISENYWRRRSKATVTLPPGSIFVFAQGTETVRQIWRGLEERMNTSDLETAAARRTWGCRCRGRGVRWPPWRPTRPPSSRTPGSPSSSWDRPRSTPLRAAGTTTEREAEAWRGVGDGDERAGRVGLAFGKKASSATTSVGVSRVGKNAWAECALNRGSELDRSALCKVARLVTPNSRISHYEKKKKIFRHIKFTIHGVLNVDEIKN